MINRGRTVVFNFSLTVDDKVVFTTRDREPCKYVHGDNSILESLANRLEGLQVGDKKQIVLTPEVAYGLEDENLLKVVRRNYFPHDLELRPGKWISLVINDGSTIPAKIAEIGDLVVTLDLNHPLAGKPSTFLSK